MGPEESCKHPYKGTVSIAFSSHEHATIVKCALEIDKELQPGRSTRQMVVDGQLLSTTFEADELRLLRVLVSSYLDFATLATKTLLEFA